MADVKVEVVPIERGATTDPNNVNKHTAKGRKLVENSLQRRGAFRSIASAGKGVEIPTVYAGNLTLETAVEAGFKEIVNVHVRGDQLVNVVRDDVAPGSAEAIALGLEDNESGKQSYNPDIDILAALAAGDGAILSKLREDDKTFNGMLEGISRTATAEGKDGFDFGGLPDQDRAPFRQVTFTLHDSQFEQVEAALKLAKELYDFKDSPNENNNGNAIASICEIFNGLPDVSG